MSEENTKRFQFTFYESFYSAIKELNDKTQQAELYNAIAEYSLYGTEPDFNGILKMAWILIKPNLEVSRRKAEAGKKGGQIKQNENTNNNDNYNNLSKTQASCKQTESKIQANDKQTTSRNENAYSKSISYIEIEREEEREEEREIEKEIEEKYKKENSKEKNQIQKIKIEEIENNNWETLFDYWEQNKKGGKYSSIDSRERQLNNLKELTKNDFELAKKALLHCIDNKYQGFCDGGGLFYKLPKLENNGNNQAIKQNWQKTEAEKIADFNKMRVL